jgi:hypothetical protein
MESQRTPCRTTRIRSIATTWVPRAAGGFRTALISVTIAAFFYVAYGYVQLFVEWRRATQPVTTTSSSAAEMLPFAGALPLDGPWVFGDLNWNLRSSVSTREKIEAHINQLVAAPVDDADNLPVLGNDLVELIHSAHMQPVERNGCTIYQISRANLKCQLVVRVVEQQPRVVSFVGGYALNELEWQLFELVPQGVASRTDSGTEHLLPLPPDAVRRGGRFAADGRLLLEFVSLNCGTGSLIETWRCAGWEVRSSGLGAGACFSYLCRREDEVIYAWSADTGESLQRMMLVHSPTDDELRAQRLVSTD